MQSDLVFFHTSPPNLFSLMIQIDSMTMVVGFMFMRQMRLSGLSFLSIVACDLSISFFSWTLRYLSSLG